MTLPQERRCGASLELFWRQPSFLKNARNFPVLFDRPITKCSHSVPNQAIENCLDMIEGSHSQDNDYVFAWIRSATVSNPLPVRQQQLISRLKIDVMWGKACSKSFYRGPSRVGRRRSSNKKTLRWKVTQSLHQRRHRVHVDIRLCGSCFHFLDNEL